MQEYDNKELINKTNINIIIFFYFFNYLFLLRTFIFSLKLINLQYFINGLLIVSYFNKLTILVVLSIL